MNDIRIFEAKEYMYPAIGELLVNVYTNLQGFPTPEEQPKYYEMLANIGDFVTQPKTHLLVAVDAEGEVAGALVYFSDMQYYGSGGTATKEKNAGGFRLLGVSNDYRNKGVGKLLVQACIDRAKNEKLDQVIIHTTESMKVAWGMYLKMGFVRSNDLDFMQEDLPVFGFRMKL